MKNKCVLHHSLFDSGTYLLLTVAWFDNHRLMDQYDDKKGLFKIGDTTMRVWDQKKILFHIFFTKIAKA